MGLNELFPNSPENAFERILKVCDRFDPNDMKIVRDALKEHAFNSSPITIETVEVKEVDRARNYMTVIRRGENSIEQGHSLIKGQTDYITAKWKWLLLGHNRPAIKNFDTNPSTNDCVTCGAPNSPRDLGSGGPYRCGNCLVY